MLSHQFKIKQDHISNLVLLVLAPRISAKGGSQPEADAPLAHALILNNCGGEPITP